MFLTDCSRVPKLDCLDKRVHSNTGLPCSLAYCLDTLVYITLLCPVSPASEQSAIREAAKGNVSERMELKGWLARMKDRWTTPFRTDVVTSPEATSFGADTPPPSCDACGEGEGPSSEYPLCFKMAHHYRGCPHGEWRVEVEVAVLILTPAAI